MKPLHRLKLFLIATLLTMMMVSTAASATTASDDSPTITKVTAATKMVTSSSPVDLLEAPHLIAVPLEQGTVALASLVMSSPTMSWILHRTHVHKTIDLPTPIDAIVWHKLTMRTSNLPGDQRQPRRGRKKGGGLTRSQREFAAAAKVCHRELRAGNLPTNKAMGDCMKSEMRDRGFKIGSGRKKR